MDTLPSSQVRFLKSSVQYSSVTFTTIEPNYTTSRYSPFDTTTNGGTVSIDSENGITFDSTTGKFKIFKDGIYRIVVVANIRCPATGNLQIFDIRKSSKGSITTIYTSDHVNSRGHTTYGNANILVDLSANDTIKLRMEDVSGGSGLKMKTGSSMSIQQVV